MLDQTVFLLIYFSLYFIIIIQQLNRNLKKSLNEKTVLNLDELHKRIASIQKMIKKANNLLSPCLLIIIIFYTFCLIIICYFAQKSLQSESRLPLTPLTFYLILTSVRLLICCIFVDRMNNKVSYLIIIFL